MSDKLKEGKSTLKKGNLGTIRLDTSCLQGQAGAGGGCPVEKLLYVIFGIIAILYAVHLTDKEGFEKVSLQYNAGFLSTVFTFIDNYSPFHEVLESDEELLEKLKSQQHQQSTPEPPKAETSKRRVFSEAELRRYDGSPGSPGLMLALLGVVYDVQRGQEYYGPGGGYSFFAGRDASRAYVTGKFEEEGLVSNVDGLSSADYLGLEEWSSFYTKDYVMVGVLDGMFYDGRGEVTQHWRDLQGWIEEAHKDKDKNDVEKQMFPPCNVEWTQAEGSRLWCTKRSGGITRDWVGVPRKLFYPGQQPRCACVRDTGAPSTDPAAQLNRGDLDSPHVKEYPGCKSNSWECRGVKDD